MGNNEADDITIKCKDCGEEFTMTKKEQDWYKNAGLKLPKRCNYCRAERKITNGKRN